MAEGIDIQYLLKLNNKIFRSSQVYLDKALKKYGLTSGSYPYLLMLRDCEGINQNMISEKLGYDKAMSTRTITKLIKLGYLSRKKDESDSRAYKLYLTEEAKVIAEELIEKIHELIGLITKNLSEAEKAITMDSLNKILYNIRNLEM